MADTKTFEISPDTEIDHDNSSKEDLPAPKPEYHAPPEQQTELERWLSLKPMIAFGLTMQASWESMAISFQAALLNGGPVVLTYGTIMSGLGSSAMALSLGEMASIDPTVGAQYRWSARWAPRGWNPRFWGLFQGWLTFIAWVAGTALTPFVLGSIVNGLLIFNYPDHVSKPWHTTLLAWAFMILPAFWNIYARRLLVLLELIGGICHILFFFCVIITLIILAPRSSNEFVWETSVHNVSGWTNPGLAFCIGLLSPTFVVTVLLTSQGFDGVIHMSDEVKDAPVRIPRSMIYTVIINAVFCWAFTLVILYTIGDYNAVLNSPTGLPIIQLIYQATKSKAATNTLVSFILIVCTVGNFSIIASVSRLIWAFARDKGLPYSDYFAYIHPTLKVPTRCLGLLTVLSCLLALINIGSVTAYNAILSLATLAQYISYWFPILFFLIRKLEGREPVYGPFKLGRWGIPINIFALTWCSFMIIWLPFPNFRPVTATNMNYAGPMWLGCCLLAIADYWVTGKNRFQVPKVVLREFEKMREKEDVERKLDDMDKSSDLAEKNSDIAT